MWWKKLEASCGIFLNTIFKPTSIIDRVELHLPQKLSHQIFIWLSIFCTEKGWLEKNYVERRQYLSCS